MKKLAMFVAATAMAIPVPLIVSTPANAAPNSAVGFCKGYVASGYDANFSVGQCTALLTTDTNYYDKDAGGDGFATQLCLYYHNNYPDFYDYYGWDSVSDCVQELHTEV